MCGLVGVAGKVHAQHETALKQLLITDSLRGAHSTGIATVGANWNVAVAKEAVLPHYLLGMQVTKDAFLRMNKVIIGHNRFATQGAINRENAHPYEFTNIVGAHNGTLLSHNRLPVNTGYEVDSQMLLASIDLVGSEKVADKINGAFALTWYDKRDNTVHFWRNMQRPLWLCYLQDQETVFWASEKEMLEFILARNNLKHTGMFELPAHKEYVYSVNGTGKLTEVLTVHDRDYFQYAQGGYRSNAYSGWDDYDPPPKDKGVYYPKKQLALVVNNRGEDQVDNQSSQTVIILRLRLKRLSDQLLTGLLPE